MEAERVRDRVTHLTNILSKKGFNIQPTVHNTVLEGFRTVDTSTQISLSKCISANRLSSVDNRFYGFPSWNNLKLESDTYHLRLT